MSNDILATAVNTATSDDSMGVSSLSPASPEKTMYSNEKTTTAPTANTGLGEPVESSAENTFKIWRPRSQSRSVVSRVNPRLAASFENATDTRTEKREEEEHGGGTAAVGRGRDSDIEEGGGGTCTVDDGGSQPVLDQKRRKKKTPARFYKPSPPPPSPSDEDANEPTQYTASGSAPFLRDLMLLSQKTSDASTNTNNTDEKSNDYCGSIKDIMESARINSTISKLEKELVFLKKKNLITNLTDEIAKREEEDKPASKDDSGYYSEEEQEEIKLMDPRMEVVQVLLDDSPGIKKKRAKRFHCKDSCDVQYFKEMLKTPCDQKVCRSELLRKHFNENLKLKKNNMIKHMVPSLKIIDITEVKLRSGEPGMSINLLSNGYSLLLIIPYKEGYDYSNETFMNALVREIKEEIDEGDTIIGYKVLIDEEEFTRMATRAKYSYWAKRLKFEEIDVMEEEKE